MRFKHESKAAECNRVSGFPHRLLILAALAGVCPVYPQPSMPPQRRQAPVRSPEIQAGRIVTFRLQAPDADSVSVAGQWPNGRTPMVKDTAGVWSATVGPIDPGVWEYSFRVNGLTMIDPGNEAIKPMHEPRTSILHLPGQPPLLHDFQDVPHGSVRRHAYFSKSLGRLRELEVYTPPGYDRNPKMKYPTLYLQHGRGDNQDNWTVHGKAHWILDNLIAQGRAVPMVIVMMDGHAAEWGGGAGGARDNTGLFERDLLEDVMPFVEAEYRVKNSAADRAICGLSMGGGQSLTVGLNHLDRFAWVGGFSAGTPPRDAIAAALSDPESTNKRLKLLWIGCGEKDFLIQRNDEFIALLKENNIRHEWHLTQGDHSWPVWRIYLGELAPRLFR
jgi:enterochelin esterase family protein